MVSFCVLRLTRWSDMNETFVRGRLKRNYGLLKFSAFWDKYSARNRRNRHLTAIFDRLKSDIKNLNRG